MTATVGKATVDAAYERRSIAGTSNIHPSGFDSIMPIFPDEATYHERVLEAPIRDRERIRAYWQAKVVESQGGIKCELLNLYLDGNTAIVEREAQFDDLAQRVRKRTGEVAILVFEGQLIASLREYCSSEQIANLPHR